MTIEWDDLRRFKAYRVVNIRGVEGVMTADVHGSGESRHYVYWSEGYGDWLREDGTIYSIHDQDTQVTILGELKLPSQLTAEDLDACIIKAKDEGEVLFADGHARLYNKPGNENLGTWRSPCPVWMNAETAEENRSEYLTHVEQQKNPPIEIKWDTVLDNNGLPAHSACRVRGDFWQLWHRDRNAANPIGMYLNRQFFADSNGFGDSESKMRNHYKTTK